MEITYSPHARNKVAHRGISEATIRAVIANPERETWDGTRSARYLAGFCVVVIPNREGAHVVTVYDMDAQEPERTYKDATGTRRERRKKCVGLKKRNRMRGTTRRLPWAEGQRAPD
jgi:hypothetical protein